MQLKDNQALILLDLFAYDCSITYNTGITERVPISNLVTFLNNLTSNVEEIFIVTKNKFFIEEISKSINKKIIILSE